MWEREIRKKSLTNGTIKACVFHCMQILYISNENPSKYWILINNLHAEIFRGCVATCLQISIKCTENIK